MNVRSFQHRMLLARGSVIVALVALAVLTPRARTTYASTASSSLPLTTSGVHLGMVFNNYEATVNGYKTQESNVDYVYSADGGMHNVPANSGHPWHDKYLSWSRDAASGAEEPTSWYKQYHPDWLLYKSDRTTIPIAMNDYVAPLDFTNPAVQQYIVSKWINPALAGGFQGVVFDNDLGFNYLGAAGHYTTSGTWVQQYTGSWSDPTYANAQAAAFQQIVALVHASHPTATVGINQGVDCNNDLSLNEAGQQYADIITDEEGFTNSANTSLPYIAQYANTVCPNGKWLTVMQWAQHLGRDLGEGLFIMNPESYSVTAYMTDSNSQARFDLQWSLANYLLIKYSHTYFRWGGHTGQYGYPLVPQHEYTTVQAIGSPTDDFYASQQVYMRDFTGGLAVVNPNRYNAYTVTFPAGKYKDLYGTPITTVSLPAHSGLVLLLAGSASPPSSSSGATMAVEGTNGALWVKHGTGSWTNFGGALSGAPAVVQLPGGADLYVVAGTNHTLWERTDSTGWRQLSSFACMDNPAATISGTTITVACQSSNHAIYLAQTAVSSNTVPTTLSAFSSLGGTTYYGPAVGIVNGALTYFVTGTDGRVWWRTLSQGWTALSGATCSGHPAASTAGTTSYLACNGGASGVWYTRNTGSGWSSWTSIGGSCTDGPGVAASSSGAVIVAEGTSNVVYQNQLSSSGAASGWQSTGGTALHGAAAG